jgi:hypothetical protein
MNSFQRIWWEQVKSDYVVFSLVRASGVAQCHSLHYLQMVSEKIAKAYYWRTGGPPPRKHVGFVDFLRSLGVTRQPQRQRIARLFGFSRFADFQNWLRSVLPIAYDLERLAPSLAADGPNPEYPWPHMQPNTAPVQHEFAVWATLASGRGRDLMRVIHIAVERFPEYADL